MKNWFKDKKIWVMIACLIWSIFVLVYLFYLNPNPFWQSPEGKVYHLLEDMEEVVEESSLEQ